MLLAGERPLARWGVLRRARAAVEDGRLMVRGRSGTHAWALGPGGAVASAVHVRGKVQPPPTRREGTTPYNASGGTLHLCDASGASVARLIVSDWLPNGTEPVTMDFPDAIPTRGSDLMAGQFLRLSGLRDFLTHHGLLVREADEPPPPAPEFAGTLRPGPSGAVPLALLLPALALVLAGLLALAVTALAGDGETARNVGFAAVTAPLMLLALLSIGFAGVTALRNLAALRAAGADAELRPSPGVPVTRAFLGRSSLRLVGENLELRTAQNVLRLMRGPADPVLGVREAVVLEESGRPWAVVLLDRRESVQAFLHWDTWFRGDPQLGRLRAFCEEAGLVLARRATARRFPAGPANATDRTARKPGLDRAVDGGRYAFLTLVAFPCMVAPPVAFARGADGGIDWAPYYVMSGVTFAVAFVPWVIRLCARVAWLDRLVTAERVSEVTYRRATARTARTARKTAKETRRG
ncbi:hypothetical protein RM780_10950 [Streptomyces sp. DSM 44917]|uniref:PH domain-containing protein n=1 Tax=Streptomyces boetiae TaxID=3075541 RepID=A0ABU2L7C3_9ACTN|nr:hypothetical protein [Streptomyces sp. DSM 44917]MDT0307480.1 hypothetical protein [Streptomyces sp. DSM 44917]